ncbi:MAG: YajQ family cyclic di-GMP-binding protein [Myxococcaceae bacterium]
MPSFDVVSKIDMQELDNALNQTRKELSTRYDFQGTKTEITLEPGNTGILLKSADKGKLEAAYEVMLGKLAKRGVTLRGFEPQPIDSAALGQVKQLVKIQQGIAVEKSKELVKALKDSKLKVQGSIQGDSLRVSGKSRDDLQSAIAFLRTQQDTVKLDLQFNNFRD